MTSSRCQFSDYLLPIPYYLKNMKRLFSVIVSVLMVSSAFSQSKDAEFDKNVGQIN